MSAKKWVDERVWRIRGEIFVKQKKPKSDWSAHYRVGMLDDNGDFCIVDGFDMKFTKSEVDNAMLNLVEAWFDQ